MKHHFMFARAVYINLVISPVIIIVSNNDRSYNNENQQLFIIKADHIEYIWPEYINVNIPITTFRNYSYVIGCYG